MTTNLLIRFSSFPGTLFYSFCFGGWFQQALEDLRVLGLRDSQTKQGYEAIDQVEFDADQAAHKELLPASSLVVRYSDYASGECMTWAATPPDYCGFARDAARKAHPLQPSAADPDLTLSPPFSPAPPRPSTPKDCTSHLDDHGYVVLSNALPRHKVLELRDHLKSALLLAIDGNVAPAGDPASSFAKINTRQHRHDLRLKMTSLVKDALKTIAGGTYGKVYQAIVPSDAPLVELGVITSHPGSDRQTIHSDV